MHKVKMEKVGKRVVLLSAGNQEFKLVVDEIEFSIFWKKVSQTHKLHVRVAQESALSSVKESALSSPVQPKQHLLLSPVKSNNQSLVSPVAIKNKFMDSPIRSPELKKKRTVTPVSGKKYFSPSRSAPKERNNGNRKLQIKVRSCVDDILKEGNEEKNNNSSPIRRLKPATRNIMKNDREQVGLMKSGNSNSESSEGNSKSSESNENPTRRTDLTDDLKYRPNGAINGDIKLKNETMAKPRESIGDDQIADANHVKFESSSFLPSLMSSSDGLSVRYEGIKNLGNTCYLSAIMQALVSLDSFMAQMNNEKWIQKISDKTHAYQTQLSAFMTKAQEHEKDVKEPYVYWAFLNAAKMLLESNKQVKNIETLYKAIGKRSTVFASYVQQDAHEILLFLLEELHVDMKMVAEYAVNLPDDSITYGPISMHSFFAKIEPSTKTKITEEATKCLPSNQLFESIVSRKLCCLNCSYTREVSESYRVMSVDVPKRPKLKSRTTKLCLCGKPAVEKTSYRQNENHGRKFYGCAQALSTSKRCKFFEWFPISTDTAEPRLVSLRDLYMSMLREQTVDINCEKCKTGKKARMSYEITNLPDVMILHIKRFEISNIGSCEKRTDRITIPQRLLIPGNMTKAGIDTTYNLQTLVHHKGETLSMGHYVTDRYMQNDTDLPGSWMRFDDSAIQELPKNTIGSERWEKTAYITFYTKADSTTN